MRFFVSENGIELYRSSNGAKVFRIPLELFPSLTGFAHLVIAGDITALIDVGSGVGDSNQQLEEGLLEIKKEFGDACAWSDLSHIIITHGHIDHFGGLPFVKSKTSAPIGVHELDRRVLTGYEERLVYVAHRLQEFLIEAGVSSANQEALMNMYLLNKHLFKSVPIDFVISNSSSSIGPLSFIHVPGHCPGQIAIRVDDILLTSDHVLKNTSPHQSPEQLTMNTGLGHYLDSLEKIEPLSTEINVSLGGHEPAMKDLGQRILEIVKLHEERLEQVMTLLDEPRTVAQISNALFPGAEGYHELLAIEEAGAHVEYLAQRGHLAIENLEDLEMGDPVPIRYRRRNNIPPLKLLRK